MAQLGKQLESPPSDGISALRFGDSDALLASSWDGVGQNEIAKRSNQDRAL
jgi:hypothetical protein